jgi:hypothetical protein
VHEDHRLPGAALDGVHPLPAAHVDAPARLREERRIGRRREPRRDEGDRRQQREREEEPAHGAERTEGPERRPPRR